MQKLLVALLAFFAVGLLYVLHEHAQTGRYQAAANGDLIIDTQTGRTWSMYTPTNPASAPPTRHPRPAGYAPQ